MNPAVIPKDCWLLIFRLLSFEDQSRLFRTTSYFRILNKEWRDLKEEVIRKSDLEPEILSTIFKQQDLTQRRLIITERVVMKKELHRGLRRLLYSYLEDRNFVSIQYENSPDQVKSGIYFETSSVKASIIASFYSEKKDQKYRQILVNYWKEISFSNFTDDGLKVCLTADPLFFLARTFDYYLDRAFEIFCSEMPPLRFLLDNSFHKKLRSLGFLTMILQKERFDFLAILANKRKSWQRWFFPEALRENAKFMSWITDQPFMSLVVVDSVYEIMEFDTIDIMMANLGYICQINTGRRHGDFQIYSKTPILKLWYHK